MSGNTSDSLPTNHSYTQANHVLCGDSFKAEVFDSFSVVCSVQDQWDELIKSLGYSIFLTYDWCRVWWKHFGDRRELRIFVFKNENNIVGVLPLFLEKIRLGVGSIRVAKIVGADFTLTQFNLPVIKDYLPLAMQAISSLLAKEKWDVMYLGPLAGLYNEFDALCVACNAEFSDADCIRIDNQNVQTYFELPSDWDTYLSRLSKQERSNVRRAYAAIGKVLKETSLTLQSQFASEANISEYFDEFVSMHQVHWHKLGKAGHFGDWPGSREFHKELAEVSFRLNRLRFLKVQIGEHCLGYQFHYQFGRHYCDFLDARTDSDLFSGIGPGRVTFCEVVKKAIEEGVQLIDSMRGRYEHKLRLGGRLFAIKGLYLVRRSPSSKIKAAILFWIARIINICYYKIWYCKIVPKLPVKFGPLWKYWIRTNMFASIKGSRDKNGDSDFADTQTALKVDVYTDFEKLRDMQAQWDSFVESVGSEVFLTYDWCRIWWKYYSKAKTLRVFVFRNGEQIVGLLPTYIETIRIGLLSVKVAQIAGTPEVPVEVSPPISPQFIPQVIRQWFDMLSSEFNPDIICVGPLPGTYGEKDRLAAECGDWCGNHHVCEEKEAGVQTVFSLGASFDEYLAKLPKNEKREMNRHCRNILKVGDDNCARMVSEVFSGDGLSGVFDDFVQMHNFQWEQVGHSGHFNDWPKSEAFHREVAQTQLDRGRLRLIKMRVGNYCTGYEYAYKFSKTLFAFLNSRTSDKRYEHVSVGRVHFCELVQKALVEGATTINSMRGKYEYKLRMGGVLVPIHAILVFRKGLFSRLKVRLFKCLSWLIDYFYYRVWFANVVPRIRLKRKLLMNLWIKTSIFAHS
jgi:CelD/BcsL family acetyltransferase involved in cellulose biosynthesis